MIELYRGILVFSCFASNLYGKFIIVDLRGMWYRKIPNISPGLIASLSTFMVTYIRGDGFIFGWHFLLVYDYPRLINLSWYQ